MRTRRRDCIVASLSLSLSRSFPSIAAALCRRDRARLSLSPNPRKSGSVIGADRRRSGPSGVLLKRVPQGQTESGGIVLAANAGPRVPRSGATRKRRSTYRPSVIYLIVNKLLSLSLSLSPFSLSREAFLALRLLHRCFRRSSGRPTAFVNLFFLSFARSRSYPLRYLFYTIHF